MSSRVPISPKLRFTVLLRDDFACRYCGARAPEARLHVDRIVPVADGGATAAWNLVAACQECNLGKGTLSVISRSIELVVMAQRVCDALKARFPTEFRIAEAFPLVLRTLQISDEPYGGARLSTWADRCAESDIAIIAHPDCNYEDVLLGWREHIRGAEDYDAMIREREAANHG